MNDLLEKAKSYTDKATEYVVRYKFTIMVVVIGGALVFALMKTGSYLNIPRNEDRYNEETLLINYKEIDSTILEEFKAAEEDIQIEVESNFEPGRNNPFSE